MKYLICIILLVIICKSGYAQTVEVQGQLKVTTINQNNASTDVLVRNIDGSVGKRDAGTIGGVPSAGIVLSDVLSNSNLTSNNFSLLGSTRLTYIPATSPPKATTTVGAPSARRSHKAVVVQGIMIIYGNEFGNSVGGSRYYPATNTWLPISTVNAPSNRNSYTCIAAGNEMIVWGGFPSLNSGARYNPVTDVWTTMSTLNAPSGRYNHSAVFYNNQMIIWGGVGSGVELNTGARYNVTTGVWATLPISTTNAPSARSLHLSSIIGDKMFIYSGYTGNYTNGGIYDLVSNTWTLFSNGPYYEYGTLTTICLTCNNKLFITNHGGSNPHTFEPVTNSFIALPSASFSIYANAVCANSEIIFYGGESPIIRYNLPYYYWEYLPNNNAPPNTSSHTLVWTGSEMISWGGEDPLGSGAQYNTGYIYNPNDPGWGTPINKNYYYYKKN